MLFTQIKIYILWCFKYAFDFNNYARSRVWRPVSCGSVYLVCTKKMVIHFNELSKEFSAEP